MNAENVETMIAGRQAARFAAVWDALADIMGSSATATLLRRAAKHAARDRPDLAELVITKRAFEYEYVTPASWTDPQTEAIALRALLRSLRPLLIELTGEIVINRLRSIPQVQPLLMGDES